MINCCSLFVIQFRLFCRCSAEFMLNPFWRYLIFIVRNISSCQAISQFFNNIFYAFLLDSIFFLNKCFHLIYRIHFIHWIYWNLFNFQYRFWSRFCHVFNFINNNYFSLAQFSNSSTFNAVFYYFCQCPGELFQFIS